MFSLIYFSVILFIILFNVLIPNIIFRRKIEKKILSSEISEYTCFENTLFKIENMNNGIKFYYFKNLKEPCKYNTGAKKIRCTGKDFYDSNSECTNFLNYTLTKTDFSKLYI